MLFSKINKNTEETKSLVRLLVFLKIMDVYRSIQQPVYGVYRSMQQPSSEDAAARTEIDGDGRELETVKDRYKEYSWDDCLAFYEWVQDSNMMDSFCRDVSPLIKAFFLTKYGLAGAFALLINADTEFMMDSCMEIVQCPSTSFDDNVYLYRNTPSMCCGYQGLSPPVLSPPGPTDCTWISDCLPITGSSPPHAVCREGQCQSGKSGSSCGQTIDCLPLAKLSSPHGVCRNNECQR